MNTTAIETPDLIDEAARSFGSQCVVVSIDALRHGNGHLEVCGSGGKAGTGLTPAEWACQVEDRGAGELLINSIDRDGTKLGYDLDLVRSVTRSVSIPVIACGGVGKYEDFPSAILESGASAAAAANIFHFFELSYPLAKRAMLTAGVTVRKVGFERSWFPREPHYDKALEDARIADRIRSAQTQLPVSSSRPAREITWCTQCLYPTISAAPIEFDNEGVCTGCRQAEIKVEISKNEWARRRELLQSLLQAHSSSDGSRHDCVVAVSGGKDSWYQVHLITNEFGLNPLLVTYDTNNWTPAGWRNMLRSCSRCWSSRSFRAAS